MNNSIRIVMNMRNIMMVTGTEKGIDLTIIEFNSQ